VSDIEKDVKAVQFPIDSGNVPLSKENGAFDRS
jgi:hypothetical protein